MKNANQHIRLTNEYFNAFTYDAMGNILTQQRHNRAGHQFDNLSYHYQKDANGNLERNRLYHVNDAVSASFDSTDIDDMGTFISAINQINTDNNYVYDKEGRLVKDKQEEIDTILWTVTGKVSEIKRSDTSHKKNLKFDYDAFGRRIAKHVYNNETAMLEKSTYYILDASGNQLSMYEHFVEDNTAKFYLAERNIYGSSRLGSANDTINMFMSNILPSYGILGNRQYELSNHLGNILTVINDVKYPLSNDNVSISGYEVGMNGISDYSPFGASLDGRTIGNLSRYGFIGMENDNEISGVGNSQDHKFRSYDTRLGRYKSLDPLAVDYPWNSPYSYAENRVIDGYDLEGREWENFMSTFSSVENLKPKLPNINNGEIQKQIYKVVVSNSGMTFKELKDLFISTPEKILSNDKAEFKPISKEGSDQFKLEVGANIRINIDLFMNNSFVRVTKVNIGEKSISATFTTLKGHVEAGVITFSIKDLGDNKLAFIINGVSQVDYGMVTEGYAREQQATSWFEVLQNFIDVSQGVEESRTVNITSQTAEPDGGEIKEVSISRTVKKGNKDFKKQAKETREAVDKAKGS